MLITIMGTRVQFADMQYRFNRTDTLYTVEGPLPFLDKCMITEIFSYFSHTTLMGHEKLFLVLPDRSQ